MPDTPSTQDPQVEILYIEDGEVRHYIPSNLHLRGCNRKPGLGFKRGVFAVLTLGAA